MEGQEGKAPMKVWMSPETKNKNRYALESVGGLLGIVAVMLAFIAAGSILPLMFGWDVRYVSLTVCIAVTVLGFWLARRLGQRSVRNALCFFLDEEDRLYALDVRLMVRYGRGLSGYAEASAKIQHRLDEIKRMADSGYLLSSLAIEILQVESIREKQRVYSMICRVQYGNGGTGKRTLLLVKGYEEEESLIRELERREV